MKPAKLDQLGTIMYQWIIEERSQGIAISDPIMMAKAVHINNRISKDPSFKAITGWLYRFQWRHAIRQLDISGEELNTDSSVIGECRDELTQEIEKLKLVKEQVNNYDEIGLHWKVLPVNNVSTIREKSVPRFKMQKDHCNDMSKYK